jgi:ammonia channel protein AmtB
MVSLSSRTKADRTAFTVALPSAIALYFANLLTAISAGGYNNPVVALVIDIQNKKYTLFSGLTPIPGAYQWAMISGAVAGGLLAGFACIILQRISAKIKEDETTEIFDSNPSAEVEQ